ncbi:hypothetical protein [Nocardia tengchongensis]|uniref:hypothetical protein n=1 Tax=Nocardia tengchongensis TaxID=2055889 RepID=UPI0036544544
MTPTAEAVAWRAHTPRHGLADTIVHALARSTVTHFVGRLFTTAPGLVCLAAGLLVGIALFTYKRNSSSRRYR